MSGGRESQATENLGRAPRGRLQSARLGPTSSPSWREKKATAPRTSAPPTLPYRTPLPQALPSPGAIVKWLGKRLVRSLDCWTPFSSSHQEPPRHSGRCTIAKVRGRASRDPTSRLRPTARRGSPPPRLEGRGRPGAHPRAGDGDSAAHSPAGGKRAAAAATGLPRSGGCASRGPCKGSGGGLVPPPRPRTDLLLLPGSAASSLLRRRGGRLSLG